jgi:ATP-binding cassette subfamily F protein 3
MSILSAHNLAKYFGAQDVFRGLSLSLARGDKVALVGPNGTGKTTLLRILLSLEEPTEGAVTSARGLRTGYLPQHPELVSTHTLYDEMLHVFDDLRRQQAALLTLAEEMAHAPDPAEAMERYAAAEQRFELAGGYDYETRIRRVLGGLGFREEMYTWPISVLSGGQVTRALLARLLLQEPDLLVLDEPTNYLDLSALEWLEAYLQGLPQSLLVVSHDRRFLDRVVNRIWELDRGRLETYRGNYSRYVQQRLERRERQQREFEEQQEEIARTEEFIRRYKAGQRSREAAGREKRLTRVERMQAPEAQRRIRLLLNTDLRSGDKVLISEHGVEVGYRSRPDAVDDSGQQHLLFRSGPLLVERGQCIALLGPNGSGKTTFLRTLLGETALLGGDLRLGASVKIGYLSQTQHELNPEHTIMQQIQAAGHFEMEAARSLLARYLFTGDEVDKRIGDLSGGEQSRLALALLSITGANLLILDEPTTHLDVAAQEILQDVLYDFAGTILLVSHDRFLMDALATHVWAIRAGHLYQNEGNYSAFLLAEAERAAQEEAASQGGTSTNAKRPERASGNGERKRQQELEGLEREIETLERELGQTEHLLSQASDARDVERVRMLSAGYQEIQASLAERLQRWEEIAELANER